MSAPIPKEKREEIYLVWMSGRYKACEVAEIAGVSRRLVFYIAKEKHYEKS